MQDFSFILFHHTPTCDHQNFRCFLILTGENLAKNGCAKNDRTVKTDRPALIFSWRKAGIFEIFHWSKKNKTQIPKELYIQFIHQV